MDKIFCETHKCTISVSGCIKRQNRHKNNSPYACGAIPKDPMCENCAQGKEVKKGKHKPYKEEVMTMAKLAPEMVEQKATKTDAIGADLDELEKAAKKRGPGRPPKQKKQEAPGEQPKTNTQPVLEKACWVCGKHYPVTVKHFRRHGFTADGFENRCRACVGKNNILQIDFSGNMDLLDKLKTAAASEFRTPELQLMAMIAKEA